MFVINNFLISLMILSYMRLKYDSIKDKITVLKECSIKKIELLNNFNLRK